VDLAGRQWAAGGGDPAVDPLLDDLTTGAKRLTMPVERLANVVFVLDSQRDTPLPGRPARDRRADNGYRFNLSHRDGEDLLAERGIQVSYEAVRLWCRKFGSAYAEQLRRGPHAAADKWYVDEMQPRIRGKKDWL
jgi:hypothetical protein